MRSPHTTSLAARRRMAYRGVALCILALAFGLRLWQLDAQSLWHDEGLSWWFARAPLLETLKGVAGTEHPPLYFLALGVWLRLAGDSPFALRFLSTLGSVLAVAVILDLGRRWSLRLPALLAALFLAWNPSHIWYAQEVRSYAWTTVLGIALTYLGWRWQQSGRARDGLLYGVIAALALYVHTFLAFLLVAHALLLAASPPGRGKWLPRALKGVWPFAIVGITFLPWVWPTLSQLQTNRTYWYWGYLDVPRVVRNTAEAFAYYSLPDALRPTFVPRLTFFAWLLAAIGSVYLWSRREGRWLVVSTWAPVAMILLLAYFVPKYAPRYVLYVLPMWYLLVTIPLVALARWAASLEAKVLPCMVGTFLTLVIVGYGVTSWQVRELTADPRVARPDFRGPLTFVQEKAQPGDAIILVGGHMEAIARYYVRREDVRFYPFPRGLLLDLGRPLKWRDVAPALSDLTRSHARVWTVFWQEDLADPQRLIFSLAQTYWCPLMMPGLTEGVDLGLYLVVKPLDLPPEPIPRYAVDIPFRNGLVLTGFDAARVFSPRASVDLCIQDRKDARGLRVAAGETLYVVLHFRVTQPVREDLTGFVHLVSPDGSKAYALADRLLGDYAYPPWRWQVGEIVRQEFPLTIPPETWPGEYALEIGLYRPGSLQRIDPLPVEGAAGARVDGSRILVAPVTVLPP